MWDWLLGLAFVLFDVNVACGGIYIGVFPDPLGYALLLLGLRRVTRVDVLPLRRLCRSALMVSSVIYVAALLQVSTLANGWIWVALDMISYLMEAYVSYRLIALMQRCDISIGGAAGKKLLSAWRLSVLFAAVSFLKLLSPASGWLLCAFSVVADLYLVMTVLHNRVSCPLF